MREARNQVGNGVLYPKRLYVDRGGENRLQSLVSFCKRKGVKIYWSPTGEKEPQGQVEVYMGVGWRGAVKLLYRANLHPVFARFALRHFFYLKGFRTARGKTETRNELYFGHGKTEKEKRAIAELRPQELTRFRL